MTINSDPHNAGAIFGSASPIGNQLPSVPQALPRLVPPGKSQQRLSPNLRKALGDAFIADAFADWQIWGACCHRKNAER